MKNSISTSQGADTVRVAAIADQVGDTCEAAFSRAFKKATGQKPTQWRRAGGPV